MKTPKIVVSKITKEMEDSGWKFREFIDEKQKLRMVGKFEDWGCLVDYMKSTIEYWHYNHDFFLNYNPETFSQNELQLELLTCDECGLIQSSVNDLQLVNVTQKVCPNCIKNNLE